jgi:choice-of-anchor A domain-containing protein
MIKNLYFGMALLCVMAFISCNMDNRECAAGDFLPETSITRGSSDYCIDLGIAGEYTLFVFGDVTQGNTDSLGSVAAGGDVSLTNYGVALNMPGYNGDALVAGGTLTYTNGSVYNGDVAYGTQAHLSSVTILNGDLRRDSPIDFSAEYNHLSSLSAEIGDLSPNGVVEDFYGAVRFVGTDPVQNVFNVDATILTNAHTLDMDIPPGSRGIINVTGTGETVIQYKGITSALDLRKQHILFNFETQTSLIIQGMEFKGSVLAPHAHVEFNNGNIDGSIIAASLNGYGETHYYPFLPGCTRTPVPTEAPTPVPTEEPTPVPTNEPTPEPTDVPTETPVPEFEGTKTSAIRIQGSGFLDDPGLVFIGNGIYPYSSWTDTEIIVEIISMAPEGPYPLIVRDVNNTIVFTSQFTFKSPELYFSGPIQARAGDVLSFMSKYTGTDIPIHGYLVPKDGTAREVYLPRVSNTMDPFTGEGTCSFIIPDWLTEGDFYIKVVNTITGESPLYDGVIIIDS